MTMSRQVAKAQKNVVDADDIPEIDLKRARAVRRGPRAVGNRAATLKILRMAIRKTQVEVSEASGIAQGELSTIERMPLGDRRLSTIARYVEALGGELELVAVFPNGERLRVEDP